MKGMDYFSQQTMMGSDSLHALSFSQEGDVGLGEPALLAIQHAQPPVLLLLQHLNDVVLVEVEMIVGLCGPRAQGLGQHVTRHLSTNSVGRTPSKFEYIFKRISEDTDIYIYILERLKV